MKKLALILIVLAMLAVTPAASATHSDENTCTYNEAIAGCTIWVESLGGFEGQFLPGGNVKCVQMNDTMRACWATHTKIEFETCEYTLEGDISCTLATALVQSQQHAPTPISELDNPSCFPISDKGFYCVTITDTGEELTLHANTPTATAVPAPVPVFTG